MSALIVSVSIWSCSYDDDSLWNAVDDLSGRVEAMEEAVADANADIAALRTLVEAAQSGLFIESVESVTDGYIIHFSDGLSVTITNGRDGAAGSSPSITVEQNPDGVYCWKLDGEWLVDANGEPLHAQGMDGQSAVAPEVRINSDTKEWEISTDGGETWMPTGVKAEGVDGDSIFASITSIKDGETEVVFTLTDDTTITIPKVVDLGFAFVHSTELPRGAEYVERYELFASGEEKTLSFTGDVESVDVMNVPQGWSATVDKASSTVTVTAAVGNHSEGILSLVAIDGDGRTALASTYVCAVDFTDPSGAFVLNEGNMSSENGSVIYITSTGRVIDHAYWRMNGSELGNVAEDLFIAGDKLYIVSQNGGNDGILVEADASSLKRTDSFSKEELSQLSWPSHVAVVERKAYIRDNSGIWMLDLDSRSLSQVEGTSGASKNRIAVVDGKVFVPARQSVMVIENGTLVETVEMDGTVTGVVKAGDTGSLWVSCSSSPAQIVKLSATDYTKDVHTLTDFGVSAGWGYSPAISAKGNLIYFSNNTSTIYCHDFDANTTTTLGDVKSNIPNWGMLYAPPAVHPVTGEYYYSTILGYGTSYLTNDISVYDVAGTSPVMVADYQNYTRFPAGIYFTECF